MLFRSGFSSISHTPRRAYFVCALAAALAHSLRFLLMQPEALPDNIILDSSVAALLAGFVAVLFSPIIKVPAEACLFPALLPMIPGMYAYRAIVGLVGCMGASAEPEVMHNLYLLSYNGLTCIGIVLGMVIGANIPVFMLKRISFQATR